jgi:hypothetical protein
MKKHGDKILAAARSPEARQKRTASWNKWLGHNDHPRLGESLTEETKQAIAETARKRAALRRCKSYRLTFRNGRLLPLHRHIMQEHLGRELRSDMVVHHVNGDIHDNRVENLEVMSSSDHSRLHKTQWWKEKKNA